jgi:hypothetical protein
VARTSNCTIVILTLETPTLYLTDGKIVAELIHARLSIEVTAEAEGEVHDLIHLDDDEEEKVDGLDDETDPEVMDAEEEV